MNNFNPRSPCGERLLQTMCQFVRLTFQSTLPVRGATIENPNFDCSSYFNPRSPCGERPSRSPMQCMHSISIHAPRAGSDAVSMLLFYTCIAKFQSTLPVRGATAIYNSNRSQVKFITVNIAHSNFVLQTPPLIMIALTRLFPVRTS